MASTTMPAAEGFEGQNPGLQGSSQFWETEREWQTSTLARPFAVEVSDPRKVSQTFGKSFTVYMVATTTSDGSFEVRRRFSDFDWLRGILIARFHGLCVPLLPEKRIVGNQDASFIEERRQGLEKWLIEVGSNPYFRSDATLKMFLRTNNQSEFEQNKKAVMTGTGATPQDNIGLAHWYGVLRSYSLPEDWKSILEDVEEDVRAAKNALERVMSACSDLWDASKRTAEALGAMRDSFDTWRAAADASASSFHGPLAGAGLAARETGDAVGKAVTAFGEAADLAAFAPSETKMFLMATLFNELRRVKALDDLLKALKRAREDEQSAFKAQDSLQFKAKQLKDKNKADQVAALQPKIDAAIRNTQRMRDRSADIAKGLLNVEAARVSRARLGNIVSTCGQYAALGIASGERTQQLWQTLMSDLKLDQQSMVTQAQATLRGNPVPEDDGGLPGPASTSGAVTSARRESSNSTPQGAPMFSGVSTSAPTTTPPVTSSPTRAAASPHAVESLPQATDSGPTVEGQSMAGTVPQANASTAGTDGGATATPSAAAASAPVEEKASPRRASVDDANEASLFGENNGQVNTDVTSDALFADASSKDDEVNASTAPAVSVGGNDQGEEEEAGEAHARSPDEHAAAFGETTEF